MNLYFQISIFWAALIGDQMKLVAGACNGVFKGAQGEIITPGFPNRLNFTNICPFIIHVGSGRIELSFHNVSLPDGALIIVDAYSLAAKVFSIGQHRVQPLIVYTYNHNTSVILTASKSMADSYKGVKLFYRRIPEGSCKFTYLADANENQIRSHDYPKNDTSSNSTCEYYIDCFSSSHVVHIGFQDMSFGPSDVFTIFDAKDNIPVFGPLIGPQDWVRTEPTNSSAVKIVVAKKVASYATKRYSFVYTAVPKGKCVKDYYLRAGVERRFSSAGKDCLYIVRAQPKSWISLWFVSINITLPPGTVSIYLKNAFGILSDYYLTSNDTGRVRNFDSVTQGYWFEIRSANASFELKFMSYTNDKCPFYKVSESYEQGLATLGYPDNLPRNSSCEYYIRAKKDTYVVHIRFSKLFLSPGDDVTVYDVFDDSVIARFNKTVNLLLSVTAKSSSLRVVFNAAVTEPILGRRFELYHKVLPPDKCLMEFTGKTGQFSSINRPCEFNLYLTKDVAELKFENIHVPQNNLIKVVQQIKGLNRRKTVGTLHSEDNGKTKYFKSNRYYRVINIRTDGSNASFNLSFKPFVATRFVILEGSNGTLLSPYYPENYLEGVRLVYQVKVPDGHVMLNFTEMELATDRYSRDQVIIYDGNSTSEETELARLGGKTATVLPALFLGSSNICTVKFSSYATIIFPRASYRFKATYKMETQAKYCDAIKWPNSHAERNMTLPGRNTKYFCNEGYVEPYRYFYQSISRKCNFDGEWESGTSLKCLKTCPRIDEKLKVNSSLTWFYSSFYKPPYDGSHVRFSCGNYQEELYGPEIITCTSRGNYTASPPSCKERPHKERDGSSSNTWIYGASIGGTAFIISIVLAALRVFFGCFACCDSANASSSIPMSSFPNSKT